MIQKQIKKQQTLNMIAHQISQLNIQSLRHNKKCPFQPLTSSPFNSITESIKNMTQDELRQLKNNLQLYRPNQIILIERIQIQIQRRKQKQKVPKVIDKARNYWMVLGMVTIIVWMLYMSGIYLLVRISRISIVWVKYLLMITLVAVETFFGIVIYRYVWPLRKIKNMWKFVETAEIYF